MTSTLEKTWWRKPGVCWESSWIELKLCQIASNKKRKMEKGKMENGKWKKKTLRRIRDSVSTAMALVGQRPQIPSSDCLWLIFYASWQKGMWQVLSQRSQSCKTGLCSSLPTQETKKPIKTLSHVSSSSGGINIMMKFWSRESMK